MVRVRPALLCTTLLAAGCYTYVPTSLPEVQPGASVRVRISGTEAERLEPLRFTDSRALEGALVQNAGEQVYIDALIRTVDPLGNTASHTQRLNIPATEIQGVEYRRLDVLKTAAAAGGMSFVLGGAAYVIIFRQLGGTNEFEPDEARVPSVRIPLLRFTH